MHFLPNGFTRYGAGRLRDNTGGFGSIEITGGNTGQYGGYSIEGAAVFMRSRLVVYSVCMMIPITIGQLRDTLNGTTELFFDSPSKLQTTTGGVNVSGDTRMYST